ncbi:hypothetical protein COCOBI_11-2370 [Coccomyxa sp. Obi]|nr:hypothetical protein COCOBI_11-2370 [Coccomyxa sp. Obi]
MDTEAQQGSEEPASPSLMYRRPFSPEGNLLSIHEELKRAGLGLAVGWKCLAKQRTSGSRGKHWDVEYVPPDGFQPASGEHHSKYRSRVAVLRAHGVSSRPPNWTPSPVAASKKQSKPTPSDSGPEAVAVTRKKRSRRTRPQALQSRRKTDPEMCSDEHAQQEKLSLSPNKHRRVSGPGPQTEEESEPVPVKINRGRAAKAANTEQPGRTRRRVNGWGKWQQYSDTYIAKPKPKSITTWRQLTMNQGKSEQDHKQAADSDDMGEDTEGSQSDDDESVDLQPPTVQEGQNLEADQQQHVHTQTGAQQHKISTPGHSGLQHSSSDEVDICGVNPESPIAAHRMRSSSEGRQPPET